MSFDRRTRLHHCDRCRRAMNSGADLTDMRKAGVIDPMRICASQGCRDEAAELGYLSSDRREQR